MQRCAPDRDLREQAHARYSHRDQEVLRFGRSPAQSARPVRAGDEVGPIEQLGG